MSAAHRAHGFALADQGADTQLIQDYLGHKNIQDTGTFSAPLDIWRLIRPGLKGFGGEKFFDLGG